ncbi:HAD family hydrolase [Microbacterium sp. P06]|uniref:HAD family hydrolase n=1 Tax=Microbacterium sp. P06 TaxID=3366949 RepID=UPI003744DB00
MTSDSSPDLVTVLFDIDGTLVDSNYLHVEAWDRAFVAIGHPVDVWRIHRSIGMDSAQLLENALGDEAETLGDEAKEHHNRIYLDMTERLRPIHGARELLAALSERGHRVVLATSAPQQELDALLDVLDVDDSVDAVTSSEDVEAAKPAPDIIETALARASTPADRAVMVGDSTWDVIAAGRAGVTSVGLLSGGYGREELLAAGAAAVYEDAAELLSKLAESPISLRPAR